MITKAGLLSLLQQDSDSNPTNEKHTIVLGCVYVFSFFFILVSYNGSVSKYKQSPPEYFSPIVAQPDTQLQFAAVQTISMSSDCFRTAFHRSFVSQISRLEGTETDSLKADSLRLHVLYYCIFKTICLDEDAKCQLTDNRSEGKFTQRIAELHNAVEVLIDCF